MKELSMEEKAKAYDVAIEKLRGLLEGIHEENCEIMEEDITNIFPVLKESEDEKIRKSLIHYFDDANKVDENPLQLYGIHTDKVIAWLEKQGEQNSADKVELRFKIGDTVTVKPMSCHGKAFKGEPFKIVDIIEDNYVSDDGKTYSISLQDGWELVEQKPSDKVEPKFKVGDWIVSNVSHEDYRICKILKIENGEYVIESIYGYQGHNNFEAFDKDYRLWTIQDAKDGDVLVTVDNERPFIYKGCLDPNHPYSPVAYGGIDTRGYFCRGGDNFNHWWTGEKVQPATKEQRDFLFQKMKEVCYEWHADKKELKEIEDKPLVIDEGKAEMDYCFTKMMNGEKVSSDWSEDDEETLWYLCTLLKEYGNPFYDGNEENVIDWLKSLKDRIKPQWKPSEEQIETLCDAIVYVESCNSNFKGSGHVLEMLYNDLKKL